MQLKPNTAFGAAKSGGGRKESGGENDRCHMEPGGMLLKM